MCNLNEPLMFCDVMSCTRRKGGVWSSEVHDVLSDVVLVIFKIGSSLLTVRIKKNSNLNSNLMQQWQLAKQQKKLDECDT